MRSPAKSRPTGKRWRSSAKRNAAPHRNSKSPNRSRQGYSLKSRRPSERSNTPAPCIQARQVGGDYFDFLDLGRGRFGLVTGDVAGKGIAAALLMANLQANLQIQCEMPLGQPRELLRSVNQVFHKNTIDSAYATLFFAEYDDEPRRLRYANCGHLPPLLLRSDNTLDRLESTGTVLGLFRDWDCLVGERTLRPGDTLAIYTDGITEAFNDAGEEFGEERLIDSLRRHRQLPAEDILSAVVDEVRRFSGHEQHDDMTLTIAKCR